MILAMTVKDGILLRLCFIPRATVQKCTAASQPDNSKGQIRASCGERKRFSRVSPGVTRR
ncbi:hypothetical protein ACFW04_000631 [Cataglyphis niger]